MLAWLLILMFTAPVYSMEKTETETVELERAINRFQHRKVAAMLVTKDLVNVEKDDSYPLHWAVMAMLQPIFHANEVESLMAERMKTPFALL